MPETHGQHAKLVVSVYMCTKISHNKRNLMLDIIFIHTFMKLLSHILKIAKPKPYKIS